MENKSINEKLNALRRKYGWEGYGLYFCLKEMLIKRQTRKMPFDLEFLSAKLEDENLDFIEDVIKNFGLFRFETDSRGTEFFMLIQTSRKRGGQFGNKNACKKTNTNKCCNVNYCNSTDCETNKNECLYCEKQCSFVNNCNSDDYKTNEKFDEKNTSSEKTNINDCNDVNNCNSNACKTNENELNLIKENKEIPPKNINNTPQETKENTRSNAHACAHARDAAPTVQDLQAERETATLKSAIQNQNNIPPRVAADYSLEQDLANREIQENFAEKLLNDDFRLTAIATQYSLPSVEKVKEYTRQYKNWAQITISNKTSYGAFCKQFMVWLGYELKPKNTNTYGKYKSKAEERRADFSIANNTIEDYKAGF